MNIKRTEAIALLKRNLEKEEIKNIGSKPTVRLEMNKNNLLLLLSLLSFKEKEELLEYLIDEMKKEDPERTSNCLLDNEFSEF